MEKAIEFKLEKTLFWSFLEKLIRVVMVCCSVAATGCIIYAVALRYIFKNNFYGSDEVILVFAFWLYFSGAMYGSYENSHIKADILSVLIKNIRIKDTVGLFSQTLNVVVNLILVTWALDYFIWGLTKMPLTTGLKIPLIIPQSAIFFGLIVMAFYHIYYLYRTARLYIKIGCYSKANDGDYVSEKTKNKYPLVESYAIQNLSCEEKGEK